MSLAPSSLLTTRARSSSIAAPAAGLSLTLSSTRARSNSTAVQSSSSIPSNSAAVSTIPAPLSSSQTSSALSWSFPTSILSPTMINPKSMLAVAFAMAYRAIPFHTDPYTLIQPITSKGKEKENDEFDWIKEEEDTVTLGATGWEEDEKAESKQLAGPAPTPEVPDKPPANCKLASYKQRKGHRRQLTSISSLFVPLLPHSSSRCSSPPPVLPSPVSASPRSSSHHLTAPSPRLLIPLVIVCSLFFVSLTPVVWGVYTLPIISLKSLPRTLSDINQVAQELQAYYASGVPGRLHILLVLSLTSIWKNTWSVPGSALLNVLAGALMNPIYATLLQTCLTTIGSLFSTLLSKPLAPVIEKVFPRALEVTRTAIEGKDADSTASSSPTSTKTPVWVRLTVLRLVGIVPWSGLNLVCGVCNVPLWDCAVGAFIGVLPWTAVTCQVGDILQTFVTKQPSTDSLGAAVVQDETLASLLTSPSIIGKLVFLSLLSLGPVLLRNKLSQVISGRSNSSKSSHTDSEAEPMLGQEAVEEKACP